MLLFSCVLAMLPGAGSAPRPTALATSADGRSLFVATDGAVYVWDLTAPELRAVVRGTPADTYALHPTPDGKRFVAIGGHRWYPRKIEVYDTAARKRLHTFEVTGKYGSRAAVSGDGNWVALHVQSEKPELRIWNAETGKRAEAVEKAAAGLTGTVAFLGTKLVIASQEAYTAFDPVTGKKLDSWKMPAPPARAFREGLGEIAILPSGKGVVCVAATGKRRQSYMLSIVTDKNSWFLGEAWDYAGDPVLAPDGRHLMLTAGRSAGGSGVFVLKLGADGEPEFADAKDDKLPFWGARGPDGKVPAWREWAPAGATEGGRAGADRDRLLALTYSPDGKRLFASGSLGRVHVCDPERPARLATLFAAAATTDDLPAWHIVTAGGAVVGSPPEVEALVKGGKTKSAAKVKAALGTK